MFKKYIQENYVTRCITLQGTELMSLSAAVSHFLNCLLSSAQIIHPQQNLEEVRSIVAYLKFVHNIIN